MWALSLRNVDPNRAYYGTDTRAYELLAGAFLALTPALVATATRFAPRRCASPRSWASPRSSCSRRRGCTSTRSTRGVAVTIATCVLIVAIEAADGGVVKRVLSTRSVVYLGKISYGTYLWHWLVILVAARERSTSARSSTIGIACLVATALASLSFEMLEHPVRTVAAARPAPAHRHRHRLAVSVVSALVLIPQIVEPGERGRARAPAVRRRRLHAGAREPRLARRQGRRSVPDQLLRIGPHRRARSCTAPGRASCSWATVTRGC